MNNEEVKKPKVIYENVVCYKGIKYERSTINNNKKSQ